MPSVVNRWSGDPAPAGLVRALAAHDAGPWRDAPVVFLHETGSTNDVALQAAAAGAPDGASVLARMQTAGRGRRGRTWQSPAGAGLYFSVIVRPPAAALHSPAGPSGDLPGPATLLTLMAAVAGVEAITVATGLTPTIKWPNDLIVERGRTADSGRWDRRKLAGILTEGALASGEFQQVVVGIGVNLAPGAYPPEVAAVATNLEAELGHPVDGFEVFAACRAALARESISLFAGGSADLLARWRRAAPSSMGARVAWHEDDRRRSGVTAGLSDTGALLVAPDDGGPRVALVAGDVEWD